MYYLAISRDEFHRRFAVILGCFSTRPIVEDYALAKDEVIDIIELSHIEKIEEFLYVRCNFCSTMGVHHLIYQQAYTDLEEALAACGRTRFSHDNVFKLRLDSEDARLVKNRPFNFEMQFLQRWAKWPYEPNTTLREGQ